MACIQTAARMQLIAHAAARSVRQEAEALVIQRGLVLEPAEIAPGFVKPAVHPDQLLAQCPHMADALLQMGVAPAAGGQRLDLDVAE